jgi:PST family polysaccharide transporter
MTRRVGLWISRLRRSTIVANASWLLLDKVLRLGGGLALTIWMARSVGPDAFGAFGFAAAVAAIATAVGTLGLQGVVMRDMVSEQPADRSSLLGAALTLRIVTSVVLAAGTGLAVILARGQLDTAALLTLILVSAVIPQSLDVLEWALLSTEQARLVTVTRIAVFLLFAAVRVAIIVGHGSLAAFAMTIAAEAACGSIALLLFARQAGIVLTLYGVRRAQLRRYAHAAVPLVTASLCVQAYMRADQLIIAQSLGLRDVGLYAAAARISEAWNFIPAAAMLALMPRLTAAHRRSDAEFLRMLSRGIGSLMGASLLFALAVSAASGQLIVALYGSGFAEASGTLSIHVFSCIFTTIGVASGPFFVNHGFFRLAMAQTLVSAIVNVLLNLSLIPCWGISGAAWATVASQALSAFALNAVHPSTRPLLRAQAGSLRALFRG